MTDVAQLGIRVDSAQALKAVTDLDRLAIAGARAEAATDGVGVASGRVAPTMGRFAGQSRMLAQQLSQVAQQSVATGNVMQAFAIQAADIGLAFGVVGTVLGTVATVALPLLMTSLSATSEDQIAAAESAERLKEAYDGLRASAVETQGQIDKIRFGTDDANKVQLLVEEAEIRSQITAKVIEANTYIASTTDSLDRQRLVVAGMQGEIDALAERHREIAATIDEQERRSAQLAIIEGQQAQRTAEIAAQQKAAAEAAQRHAASIAAAYENYARTRTEGEKLAEAAARAGLSASDLSHISFANIGSASDMALLLAGNLGIALDTASRLAALGPQGIGGNDPSGGTYSGRGRAPTQGEIVDIRTAGAFGYRTMPLSGGGVGGGSDPYADNLNALIENLRTEREIEDEWYQENLAILQDRRALEIMGKQAHDQAMLDLHEEYQRRIGEIDANAAQQRLNDTASLFGSLASIAQAGGEKTAKAVAAFQAIEGTINAYGAALKALNTPGITVAGRFAAYASVLAAGLKGVAAIRSAGGIGGGGAAVAAQGAAGGQAAAQATLNITGLGRERSYTGAELEQIFDGIYGVAKARGLNMPMVAFT